MEIVMKELKRVILKLSGEALSGEAKSGYDDALIEDIAHQVKKIVEKGIDVGVLGLYTYNKYFKKDKDTEESK